MGEKTHFVRIAKRPDGYGTQVFIDGMEILNCSNCKIEVNSCEDLLAKVSIEFFTDDVLSEGHIDEMIKHQWRNVISRR